MTGTITHVVTHTSTTTQTIALHAASARGQRQWNVQATPSSVTLGPGESATITVAVAVSENVPVGTVNCIAVTAASQDGSQAIAVDIVTASRMSYLPIVIRSYPP
jgi:hypothetical protein